MKKALFLDRDGIINKDYGYVYKIEDFKFNEDIFDVVKYFKDRDYLVIVVTNQSGIARGYYTENDFKKLTTYMLNKFKEKNLKIDAIYHCSHSPNEACSCRKPNTKMIIDAKEEFNIDLKNSIMVGDKQSDINLGINANIKTTVAIGQREIKDATYKFNSIKEFKEALEKNLFKL